MRLIDADALSEYLDKRRTYEVMNGRNKAYGKGIRDAMKDVEDAPTIPAIPVDWIRKYADIVGSRVRAEIVREMLDVWEKGQEVR